MSGCVNLSKKKKNMIIPQTILNVADNSGAKTVKCIKILQKSGYASIGDYILVSVRSVRTGRKAGKRIKKGQIFKALVIRTKKGISNRIYGHSLYFSSNDVILLDSNGSASLGSRIFGSVTRELLVGGGLQKILTIAKKLV